MIVRTVLAVVLAAALVGVSQPAIEAAARERTANHVAEAVEEVAGHAAGLVETDDAVAGAGARRTVTVHLPGRTLTRAGVEYLRFQPSGGEASVGSNRSAVSWRLSGGDARRRVLESVRLVTSGGEPVVLREQGRHRLVLSLRGSNAEPRVHLQRHDVGGTAGG